MIAYLQKLLNLAESDVYINLFYTFISNKNTYSLRKSESPIKPRSGGVYDYGSVAQRHKLVIFM
jgi:hypothetical protein